MAAAYSLSTAVLKNKTLQLVAEWQQQQLLTVGELFTSFKVNHFSPCSLSQDF